MINNKETIRNIIGFEDNDYCYRIQVIKRRKDVGNEQMATGEKLIQTFFIYNESDYEKCCESAIKLAIDNNARAYIDIDGKESLALAHKSINVTLDYIYRGHTHLVRNAYFTAYGDNKIKTLNKFYVLDIDHVGEMQEELKTIVENAIHELNPEIKVTFLETPNGCHAIFSRLWLDRLQTKLTDHFKGEDYKRNAPTLLFFNKI